MLRPWPRRVPVVGDAFIAEGWTGRPYASKVVELCRGELVEVERCVVQAFQVAGLVVRLGSAPRLTGEALEAFARADGFVDSRAMADFFLRFYGERMRDMIFLRWQGKEARG